jgi:hypothetical protein
MTGREAKRRLARHRLPRPSGELRRHVLASAARALASGQRPSLTDRVWFSGTWRLAWATGVVGLLIVQLLVSGAAEWRTESVLGLGRTPGERRAEAAARELGLEPSGSLRLATQRTPSVFRGTSALEPEAF